MCTTVRIEWKSEEIFEILNESDQKKVISLLIETVFGDQTILRDSFLGLLENGELAKLELSVEIASTYTDLGLSESIMRLVSSAISKYRNQLWREKQEEKLDRIYDMLYYSPLRPGAKDAERDFASRLN